MKRESVPQRAIEMHRTTGRSLDDCLIAAASQDAIERPELEQPAQSRHWELRAPTGRMCGAERGRTA